jgi:hypothetical protein
MRTRQILSVIAIITSGIIFILATQSEGQKIRNAVRIIDSNNQKPLSKEAERSLDFIKNEFEAGSIIATKYISSLQRIDMFLAEEEKLGEKLEAQNYPFINSQLSDYYLSGTHGFDLNWRKSLELYVSGLQDCSVAHYVFDPFDTSGTDLIKLAKFERSEIIEIHSKLKYCADYNGLAARELAIFEWKIFGSKRSILTYIKEYKEKFIKPLINENKDHKIELKKSIKPNLSKKLYALNGSELLNINTLDLTSSNTINSDEVKSFFAYLYALNIAWTKTGIKSVAEYEEKLKTELAELSDDYGHAALASYLLNHPERGGNLSDIQLANLALKVAKSDYDIGVCLLEVEHLQPLFKNYSVEELNTAGSSICGEVLLNQLDMLEKLVVKNSPPDPSIEVNLSDPSNLPSQLRNNLEPFFGNDGPTTYLRSGIFAIIVGCVFLYLAFLSFYAKSNNHRNRAISLVLFFDGMLLVSMFSSLVIPPRLELSTIANVLISPIPFFAFGMIASHAYFISTFKNNISNIYNRYKLGHCLSLAIPLIFINNANLTGNGYFIEGVYLNARDGAYMFAWPNETFRFFVLLLISSHTFVLANLVAELRFGTSASKDESKYYLLAYLFRMGFAAVSAWIVLGPQRQLNSTNDLFDLMISSYIFAELIYGLLFCYGIAKVNIFGITQIIKKGFVKVFFTIVLFSSFYFAQSFSESYLSSQFGNLAGLLSAAIILMLEKFICQKAYLFIDYFVPDADTLTESESIYMYLFGIASEDGVISGDERRMLELTGAKLGLEREDMLRIEKRSDV